MLSLVVITKNEDSNIARCLSSVPFIQDKVVLDSGSTDQTVSIATQLGARVFIEEWRGFYLQRVRATELAQHDWILMLDADEAISEEGQEELKKILLLINKNQCKVDAYAFPRISYHMGRWIRHGGWYPDWQLRLFDRRKAFWQEGHLHEKLEAKKIEKLKKPIRHWVFQNLSDQINTNNRYSSLGMEELLRRKKKFHLILLLFKPLGKFFETYVWKLGFLDGYPGFIIAIGAAYSMFLKYAKLWERENNLK